MRMAEDPHKVIQTDSWMISNTNSSSLLTAGMGTSVGVKDADVSTWVETSGIGLFNGAAARLKSHELTSASSAMWVDEARVGLVGKPREVRIPGSFVED